MMEILLIAVILITIIVLYYNNITSEKFMDYPKFEKLTENEKPINYSVYEIKDPKRYINARVFNPGPNKKYSLLGNFEKNERLPPICEPPYKLPKNPWE
jgi:hypothetical protein